MAETYYTDRQGVKHYAPYWTEEEMHEAWAKVRGILPNGTTEYDFWVAMNMVKADYGCLLDEWFPDDDTDEKIVEMACTFFNDVDSDAPSEKIWLYYN